MQTRSKAEDPPSTAAPPATAAPPTTTAPPPPDLAMLDSLVLTLTPVATLDAPLALLAVPGTDVLLAAARTGPARTPSPPPDATLPPRPPPLPPTPLA